MKTNVVHKLKSNNENLIHEAIQELYDEYYKLVYFCINGIVENSLDTEDLVEEVFLKIYNVREILDSSKNLKYYIITIAKNLAIDFLRKKKTHVEYNEDYVLNYVVPTNKNNQTFNELIEMLEEYLSKEEIDIIVYHFLYNETFESIARKLGKPASTIRTIYNRSLKKVRKWKKMKENY